MDFLELYFEKPRPKWVIPNGVFPFKPLERDNGVFFTRPTDHSLRLPKWDGANMEFKFKYVLHGFFSFHTRDFVQMWPLQYQYAVVVEFHVIKNLKYMFCFQDC